MMIKIGLMGLAGSGKDTFAELLQAEFKALGLDVEIDRFAAPLKRAAERVFGPKFDDRATKEVPELLTAEQWDRLVDASFLCAVELFGTDEYKLDQSSDLHAEVFAKFDPFSLDPLPLSSRLFQQLLGTEVMRAVDPECFTRRIFNSKQHVIATDVRFENEATGVANTGGVLYCLIADRATPESKPEHVSEHLAWNFTKHCEAPVRVFRVLNNQDISALAKRAKGVALAHYLDDLKSSE